MEFINNAKFWRVFCAVLFFPGLAMSIFSWFFRDYESIIGAIGGFFILIAWVGYCVLAGIKREQQLSNKENIPCPYKVEA